MEELQMDLGGAAFDHLPAGLSLKCTAAAYYTASSNSAVFQQGMHVDSFSSFHTWVRFPEPFRMVFNVVFPNDTLFHDTCEPALELLRVWLQNQSFWSQCNLAVHDVSLSEDHHSPSAWQQSTFEIHLVPLPVNLQDSISSRRQQRVNGFTVNEVNPPLSLSVISLHRVHLNMTISTVSSKSSQGLRESPSGRNTNSTTFNSPDHLAEPDHCGWTTGVLSQDKGNDQRCMRSDALQGLMQHAVTALCASHKSHTTTSIEVKSCTLARLQSAFPAAFSARALRCVVEKTCIVPSISRNLDTFARRFSIVRRMASAETPTTIAAGSSMPGTPECTSRESALWSAMLAQLCSRQSFDRASSSTFTQLNPRHVSCTPQPNAYEARIRDKDRSEGADPSPIELTSDILFPLANRPDRLNDVVCIEDAWHFRELGTNFNACSEHVRNFDEFSEISFEDICIRQPNVTADTSAWLRGRDTDTCNSQASTTYSGAWSVNGSANSIGSYRENVNSQSWMEWDTLVGECQQLSQSSSRTEPSEELIVDEDPREWPDCASRATTENTCFYADAVQVANLECTSAFLKHHTDSTKLPENLSTLRGSHLPYLSKHADIFVQHESEYREIETKAFDSVRHLHDETSTQPMASRRTSTSSILTMGLLHRHNSCNLDDTHSPRRMNIQSKRSSMSSPTNSENQSQRPTSLMRRLTQRKSSKQEDPIVTEIVMDNIRTRDVNLKRRKTLDDYLTSDEEDDDEMLFV